jgi:hypothetical protein
MLVQENQEQSIALKLLIKGALFAKIPRTDSKLRYYLDGIAQISDLASLNYEAIVCTH